MGQQNVLIPYEVVAAYNASQGRALYNGDSGGGSQSETGFHVNWDEDLGFTNGGWDIGVPNSPAENKTEEDILNEINTNHNLDDLFDEWEGKVSPIDRLDWMNTHKGCLS